MSIGTTVVKRPPEEVAFQKLERAMLEAGAARRDSKREIPVYDPVSRFLLAREPQTLADVGATLFELAARQALVAGVSWQRAQEAGLTAELGLYAEVRQPVPEIRIRFLRGRVGARLGGGTAPGVRVWRGGTR